MERPAPATPRGHAAPVADDPSAAPPAGDGFPTEARKILRAAPDWLDPETRRRRAALAYRLAPRRP